MPGNHLPVPISTFVGRESTKREIESILHSTARLLTITGPGGCGKTRLTLEIARGEIDHFTGGVWWISLGGLFNSELIEQVIATNLGLKEIPGQLISQTLIDFLNTSVLPHGKALLILDNCEHLLEACAKLVFALLTSCPELQILTTSREPFHITGEVVWSLLPLEVPKAVSGLSLAELMQTEAVHLFIERARSVSPGIEINAENIQAIVAICSRLDGIPLAIELAAARSRAMSLDEIAVRLDDSMRLLEGTSVTMPSRQRTLNALFDWSYHLLSNKEKRLFRCLAAFANEFTLEALEDFVIGFDGWFEGREIFELLTQLVEKSLVQVGKVKGKQDQYRLLYLLRQYARRRLYEAGEEEQVRNHHLEWCLALAEQTESNLTGIQGEVWKEKLEQYYPDLRLAMDWAAEQGLSEIGCRLAIALSQFWQMRVSPHEGLHWIERFLVHREQIKPSIFAKTLSVSRFLMNQIGDFSNAQQRIEQALTIFSQLGDLENIALLKKYQSFQTIQNGDFSKAAAYAREGMRFSERAGNLEQMEITRTLLGEIAFMQGDFATSKREIEISMMKMREFGNQLLLARRLTRLGEINLLQRNTKQAFECLEEGLELSHKMNDHWGEVMGLVGIAALTNSCGRAVQSARLIGAARSLIKSYGTQMWPVDHLVLEQTLEKIQKILGLEDCETALQSGYAYGNDVESAVQLALQELKNAEGISSPLKNESSSPLKDHLNYGPLTKREHDVAELISEGSTNAEIAESLVISKRTVTTHVTHILNKLGFSSRAQIAAWVAKHK